MTSARDVARRVLVRVDDGAYSNLVLPEALRRTSLRDRDRAFATDLVYGTLRAQRRLDARLAPHSHRPLDQLDSAARAALRLGAYQLERGVASHAAVGETVAVAPARVRGYVNAVLRALAATGPPWPALASEGEELSYPDWVLQRLDADLGVDDARGALLAQNEPPVLTLRPNVRRLDVASLATELQTGGATTIAGTVVPDAVAVRAVGDPRTLPAVAEGRATPQDQSSQAVVNLVGAAPGDRVLDVAAAPGGKATGLGERVAHGTVVAVDVHAGRLALVGTAARRLGLENVHPVLADGRVQPVAAASMDRVLVDPPCSGLGVLRRRPEARWRVGEPTEGLLALQRDLVVHAVAALRPGGRLVYSVCTLTRAETVDVVDAAVAVLGTTVTVLPPPSLPWKPWGGGALLLPQAAGTDGMFVAALERC